MSTAEPCTREQAQGSRVRKAPHRKHFYSWIATDRQQLKETEELLMQSLSYTQAIIAGINTVSTDNISSLDDGVLAAKSGLSAMTSSGDLTNTSADAQYTPRSAEEKQSKDILVLVHGFAGGVAGWAQNWRFFAERYRVYAIDLPGFARSERRSPKARTVQEAMDYFCGYLQRWFERLQFGRPVIVLAHSFGCFVSAHYAMRCGPAQIKLLCLTEPWGMMRGDPKRIKTRPLFLRLLLTVFYHVSPLALLRWAGPAGPPLLRRTRPDFKAKWTAFLEDTAPVYDYLYHCNAQRRPVGERVFQACCHYDVCAKEPLPDVLPEKLDRRIRVALMFGGKSWLAPREAMEMAEVMRAKGFHISTHTLETAGHQIFTDDVAGFNALALEVITALESEPAV